MSKNPNLMRIKYEEVLITLDLFFQFMSANENTNVGDDRKFHELEEYVINFRKVCCHNDIFLKVLIPFFAFEEYIRNKNVGIVYRSDRYLIG